MRFLITLCNRNFHHSHSPEGIFLGEIDFPSGAIRSISLPNDIRQAAIGATGLAKRPGGYVALLQPRSLVNLSNDYQVEAVAHLDGVVDGHSIAYYRGAAYVVSTGTDQVFRISDQGSVDVFWQASDSGVDTVHLNSLIWHRDECLVAAFGSR